MPKKIKISDLQIKIASYGPTYMTLAERKNTLINACKERNIPCTSVTPFNELVKKLNA